MRSLNESVGSVQLQDITEKERSLKEQRKDAEVTFPGVDTDFHSGLQLASLLSQRASLFGNNVSIKNYLGIQVSALSTHHMDIMRCAVGLSDEVTG